MVTVADWPDPLTDPGWYEAPLAHAHGGDRDVCERLTVTALCWWRKPAHVDEALGGLDARDFRHGRWRTVFEAVAGLREEGRQVDAGEVVEALVARQQLGLVGGMAMVLALFDAGFPAGSPLAWAEVLAEWARRDRLTETIAAIQAEGGEVDVDRVAADLERDAYRDRVAGLDRVTDVTVDVRDRIADPDAHRGEEIGWPSLDRLYRIDRGGLTVVTGVPGSGKSSLVNAIVVRLLGRGWRFALFSPESAPTARHVEQLARIVHGGPLRHVSPDVLDGYLETLAEKVTWINSTSGVDAAEILARADTLWRRGGLDGLVIDPWNEVDRDPDGSRDTETLRISAALTAIRRWARRRAVHVWVVAHPRKMTRKADGSYEVPSLYDCANSATFRDKADMGLVLQRSMHGGPTKVHVTKVRFGDHGMHGVAKLTFDPVSGQFHDDSAKAPELPL